MFLQVLISYGSINLHEISKLKSSSGIFASYRHLHYMVLQYCADFLKHVWELDSTLQLKHGARLNGAVAFRPTNLLKRVGLMCRIEKALKDAFGDMLQKVQEVKDAPQDATVAVCVSLFCFGSTHCLRCHDMTAKTCLYHGMGGAFTR